MALAFAANGDAVTIMARSQRELEDTAATGGDTYVPSEGGYSRNADKIEQTMRTWQGVDREALLATTTSGT